MMSENSIVIGTRGSKLALWQAEWVQSALIEAKPSLEVKLEIIKTKGDKILDTPLAKVGGKGLFVKEIEEALLDGRVDLAVHSMKDMPAQIPDGLIIGCVPEREIASDVLISAKGLKLSQLPDGAGIGTSSLRRSSQLLAVRPDLKIIPLRGNLDTRLRKLVEFDELDAIVLAGAGVKRLGLEDRVTEVLDFSVMLPAVGQGALAIETRKGDSKIYELMKGIDHSTTKTEVLGERAFLNRLEGGCQVPIAAYGKITDDQYILTGLVSDLDGKQIYKKEMSSPINKAEATGVALAEELLAMGAGVVLDELKENANGA